jgi:hypothetical protein
MAKVGRVVTDPKAGSYCRITLNSGDRIVVRQRTRREGGGWVTIEEARWWFLASGATVFACDLESAEGQCLRARLVEGAPPGSARATALGAVVEYVKRCRSLGEVKAACEALVSSDPKPAA